MDINIYLVQGLMLVHGLDHEDKEEVVVLEGKEKEVVVEEEVNVVLVVVVLFISCTRWCINSCIMW